MWTPFTKKEKLKLAKRVRTRVTLYGKNGGEIKSWVSDEYNENDQTDDLFCIDTETRYVYFYVNKRMVGVMGDNITVEDL